MSDRAPVAVNHWTQSGAYCTENGGVESVANSKPELTLLQRPSTEEILALFERISGRRATAAEKQAVAEIVEMRRTR
jgi:hypothetical protein